MAPAHSSTPELRCNTYKNETTCKDHLKRCSNRSNKCVEAYVSSGFLRNSGHKTDFLDAIQPTSRSLVKKMARGDRGFRLPIYSVTDDAMEMLDNYEKERYQEREMSRGRRFMRAALREELKQVPRGRERDEWFEMTHNSRRWEEAGLQRPMDREEREAAQRKSRERAAQKKKSKASLQKKSAQGLHGGSSRRRQLRRTRTRRHSRVRR